MSLWIHKFELKPDCWVFVPSEESLQHGREIKKEIESTWVAPHYYSHLRPGGHVAALRSHIGNKLFIRADVNQFFNSINRTRVTRVLHSIFRDFNKARTAACTSVVTNPNSAKTGFILPFGFVQSPIIASLCLRKSALGNYLNKLGSTGFKVTVYMDDIIISTSQPLAVAELAFATLKKKAERSNFSLNPDKTSGPGESVTAFNIELSNKTFLLTEERLEAFKIAYVESDNIFVREGIRSYVNSVSAIQGGSL